MTDFSAAGLALLNSYEQCVIHTYDDADPRHLPIELGDQVRGYLTIGHGHRGPEAVPGATITQQQADDILADDLAPRVRKVGKLVSASLTAALVCLEFNIGEEALAGRSALHLANTGDLDDVPAHIALWNKDKIDGVLQVSAGLVSRRAADPD